VGFEVSGLPGRMGDRTKMKVKDTKSLQAEIKELKKLLKQQKRTSRVQYDLRHKYERLWNQEKHKRIRRESGAEPAKYAYTCGIAWSYEIGETDVHVFGSEDAVRKAMGCTDECGVVKLEVRRVK
jgi:cell shape-determining protein MreC